MSQRSHILIVEDREDWQDIVTNAIEAEGHKPYPTNSYDKAILALATHKFDLAIVDPVLDRENRFNRDGLSVIQKICEVAPRMPVMIITGSLTQDLNASLQRLCPDMPILLKESWDQSAFSELMRHLIGREEESKAASPKQKVKKRAPSTAILPTLPTVQPVMGRSRVLLVENRKDWQTIVVNTLEEEGYFWRVATNAQEALHELEQENFHLIILDLKLQNNELPLRSNEGWLLLDYLVQERPKTKVVILSGKASPTDVANLMTQYPILGFIEKQYFSAELIKNFVAQATQAPDLRIQTFGQFRLWRAGKPIGDWERPQAETIVKLLLVRRVRGGRAMAADELITRLWPDSDEESGRKKLLPLISVARRTLEPDIEPRDSNFILRSANGYFFDLSGPVSWDLLEFREHLYRGQELIRAQKWVAAIEEFEKGRTLYRGDFLVEDRYDDWAMDIRREITGELRDLLVNLADAYAALGRYPSAISACEDALHKDPLLESVYRRLMRFHYCNGEKGQALKVYRNCLKLFEELFGESPTPATSHLRDMIANDQPIDCQPRS
jgi:DNA-binding SARP family transcriptional activator/ActR/RegA family two-component response regulator